jgi:hypothetical protein
MQIIQNQGAVYPVIRRSTWQLQVVKSLQAPVDGEARRSGNDESAARRLYDDESAARRPRDGDSALVAAAALPRTPTYVASGLVECGEVISSSETLSVYRI